MIAKSLVLIGFKHAGKTTIGQQLAEVLDVDFIDTDAVLLEKSGFRHIRELYQAVGEKDFRLMETNILKNISFDQLRVIATGGGKISNLKNHFYIKQGFVLFIDTPFEIIYKRLQNNTYLGQTINNVDLLTLYNNRLEEYLALADYHFKPQEMNLDALIEWLAENCIA